jgi:ATP-dependent RNA helicase RhlB
LVYRLIELVREKIKKLSVLPTPIGASGQAGTNNNKDEKNKKHDSIHHPVINKVKESNKNGEIEKNIAKKHPAEEMEFAGSSELKNTAILGKKENSIKHNFLQQTRNQQSPNKKKQTVLQHRHFVDKRSNIKWELSLFDVPAQEGKMRFHDFNLPIEIMHAIFDLGFKYCTPIQKEILISTLKGIDATGRAQTGTGKTAAFLITIFNKFLCESIRDLPGKDKVQTRVQPGKPRALILAPTRELVIQIANDAKALGKYTTYGITEVFGGMDYRKQKVKLRSYHSDIVIATPGRLLDFMQKRDIFLDKVEILVIDEADRMLDMGFIPDVKKIIYNTPPKATRQTLFFSATLDTTVKRLALQWTKNAVNVEIEPEKPAGEMIEQLVYIVTDEGKFNLLYNILNKPEFTRVMVFTNRKDETRLLEDRLVKFGISCKVISGDIDQRQRLRTLNDFKAGNIRVLIATDVAGRGIHIEGVTHVINYTLPEDPEDYVHRIGRTGRAGASGISISFASEDDSFQIPAIEKLLGNKLICTYPPDDMLAPAQPGNSHLGI